MQTKAGLALIHASLSFKKKAQYCQKISMQLSQSSLLTMTQLQFKVQSKCAMKSLVFPHSIL